MHFAQDSGNPGNFAIRGIGRVTAGKPTPQTIPRLCCAPYNGVRIPRREEVHIQDTIRTGGAALGGLVGVAVRSITTLRKGMVVQVRDPGVISGLVRREEGGRRMEALAAWRQLACGGRPSAAAQLPPRPVGLAGIAAGEDPASAMVRGC